MYQMYIGKVLFPVTPGKLQIKINGTNKTITLINEGEVNLIKSPGLTDVSTEVLLPTLTEYPFAVYPNGFRQPDWYLEQLEKWKQSKKPVTFKMLRTAPDGELLWDTNIPVTIEDYTIVEDADSQGFDVTVSIIMKEHREWGAKKLIIKKSKKKAAKKKKVVMKKMREAKSPARTHTVLMGDTIQGIAKRELGDASRWKEIYNLNKSVMEAWAKKNGHKAAMEGIECWIFAGEVLKLPKS